MKKAIQRLRQAYPKLTVHCFPGFGHGDIINHPELLASELTQLLGCHTDSAGPCGAANLREGEAAAPL